MNASARSAIATLLLASVLGGCGDKTDSDDNAVVMEPESEPGPGEEPEPLAGEPEPAAPDPTTPEPSAPSPEPSNPEPASEAEPVPGEPVTPEPVAPEPVTPEPSAPEPTDEPEPSSAPDAGPPALEMLEGVCGERGEGTVDSESLSGFEERYILADEGFGDEVCIVRFEIASVGEAPPGCVDLDDVPCEWTHEVERRNPEVLLDESGACAGGALGLSEEVLAELDGSRVAYGYVTEYLGHNSVLLVHKPATGKWDTAGNATWDDETGAFRYDRRDGLCDYPGLP